MGLENILGRPFFVLCVGWSVRARRGTSFAFRGSRHLYDGHVVRGLFSKKGGSFSTCPIHIICAPVRSSRPRISMLVSITGQHFGETMGHGEMGHRVHRTCQGGGRLLVGRLRGRGVGKVTLTFL